MILFDRNLGQREREDRDGRLEELERHVRYLQEQMQYGFDQLEKRIRDSRKEG